MCAVCLVAHQKACAGAVSLGQSQSGVQHALRRGADRMVGTEKAAVPCCTHVFAGTIPRDALRSEVCVGLNGLNKGSSLFGICPCLLFIGVHSSLRSQNASLSVHLYTYPKELDRFCIVLFHLHLTISYLFKE